MDGGPPWNTDRYCELDHCPVRKQWMNSIIDVRADPYTNINTDRKSVEIRARQKLKAREQPNREPSLKGLKPEKEGMTSEGAIREYDSKYGEFVEEAWRAEETEAVYLYRLTKVAARHAFNKPRGKGKRQDCDARLRRILDERKVAIISHGILTTRRLTRNLKKLVRTIELDKLISELRDNKWDPIKMQKKGYTPKHIKLKDEQGRQVHDRPRAKTFADYYERKHWAIDQDRGEKYFGRTNTTDEHGSWNW